MENKLRTPVTAVRVTVGSREGARGSCEGAGGSCKAAVDLTPAEC